MSQRDRDKPRREDRRIPGQPGGHSGSSARPSQSTPPAVPTGTLSQIGHSAGQAVAIERQHPGPATYIRVAIALAAITAVEVAAFYIQSLRPVIAPLLLLLSASKFTLVAAFYMHLRFDSRLYRNLFALGLFIAASILVALIVISAYHGPIPGAGGL